MVLVFDRIKEREKQDDSMGEKCEERFVFLGKRSWICLITRYWINTLIINFSNAMLYILLI